MDRKLEDRLDRLNKKLVTLFEDLKDYTDTTLNQNPREEAWSVLEIMQHLMLAERQSLATVSEQLTEEHTFEKAGVKASVRSVVLNSILSIPVKFKAPFSIGRDAFIQDGTFWEIAKEWRAERTNLKHFLNDISEDHLDKAIFNHPRAGNITISGMLSYYEKHFDRHHKQIQRTLNAIDACKQL